MKKMILTALVLSLLLTALAACGAEAGQSETTPDPAPQADPVPPAEPEPTAEPEAEPLAEPESEPEPAPEPAAEPAAEPEPGPAAEAYSFNECNETVYATGTVNLRSGPGTDHEKTGALQTGDEATRIGIGFGEQEGWSMVRLPDGGIVYVNSNYISTSKPAAKQNTSGSKQIGGSSQTSKPSGGAASGSAPTAESTFGADSGQGLSGLDNYTGGVQFEEGTFEEEVDPRVQVHMG